MRRLMVRYTVKEGHAETNEELIRAVYRELHERAPGGLRYATFRLEDGLSFIHLAQVDGEQNPLAELGAFRAFVAGIGERTDEPPQTSALQEIGSYRLFSAAAKEED
jgi:hypothetical protein